MMFRRRYYLVYVTFWVLFHGVPAQSLEVSGRVVDSKRIPLPGAVVTLEIATGHKATPDRQLHHPDQPQRQPPHPRTSCATGSLALVECRRSRQQTASP